MEFRVALLMLVVGGVCVDGALFPAKVVETEPDDVWMYQVTQSWEYLNATTPTTVPNISSSAYHLPKGTYWILLQKAPEMIYTPTERDVPIPYTVHLDTLHHPENSYHNLPRGTAPDIRFRIGLFRQTNPPLENATRVEGTQYTCGYSRELNRWRDWLEDGCMAMRMYETPDANTGSTNIDLGRQHGSNSTDEWFSHNATFYVKDRCEDCVLWIRVDFAHWSSYWGNSLYVQNFSVSHPNLEVPTRMFVNETGERVTIPKHPRFPASGKSACPYDEGSLVTWTPSSLWETNTTIQNGFTYITLPENTKVLVDASSFTATKEAPYDVIVIPKTSQLIFQDEDIKLHVQEIQVYGSLRIGSEACRMDSDISIHLHGNVTELMEGVDPALPALLGNKPTKGIVAIGGIVDIHGHRYQPTWTRLGSTGYQGDDAIYLQDPVNGVDGWEIGMDILITTTVWDDRRNRVPQNEVFQISSISADGKRVGLNGTLAYRHHGGTEYQAEVGLLTRRVKIIGELSEQDSARGFGGHVMITGLGSGRFQGVESRNMGQTNVRGRYPFHYHLIDLAEYNNVGHVVEANTTNGELFGTWYSTVLEGGSARYASLLGGSDSKFFHTCRRHGRSCNTIQDTYAEFTISVSDAGSYDLLLSRPPDSAQMHRVFVPMAENVTVTISQGSSVVEQLEINMQETDPVDVLKKWTLITSLDVAAATTYTIRIQISNTSKYQSEFLALDAMWMKPQRRNFMNDCTVRDSLYRCVSIHGTNGVEVSRNVAYNIVGHCYYLEDGVEERNRITHNLASHIHPIGTPAAGGAQVGAIFRETDDVRNPADHAAAGFYITNAHNYFYGNAASGGWTGFSFPNVPLPLGAFNGLDFQFYNPMARQELLFDGNTAHSEGNDWINGNCMYVGGRLTHLEDGRLFYHSGRNTRSTLGLRQETVGNVFTNTQLFLCRRGLNHWGNDVDVIGYEIIDMIQGATLFGSAYLHKGLIVAQSSNPAASDLYSHLGFQFYDTWTQTMLDDVIFRNFKFVDGDVENTPTRNSYTNRVFEPMDHSDTFKPQGISAVRNITYENVDEKCKFDSPPVDTGAGYMYNYVSFDGTSAGYDKPAIVGSHIDWWNVGPECFRHPVTNVWICDATDGKVISSLYLVAPGVTRDASDYNQIEGHRHIGYVCTYPLDAALDGSFPNEGGNLTRCLIQTKNPITTGISEQIWHFQYFGGGNAGRDPVEGDFGWDASPAKWNIGYSQIPKDHFTVIAMAYPRGTAFNVTLYSQYHGAVHVDVPQADNLEHVLHPDEKHHENLGLQFCQGLDWDAGVTVVLCNSSTVGPLYFYDETAEMLFVRFVNPMMHYSETLRRFGPDDSMFERNGMWINNIQNLVDLQVTASCDVIPGTNLCRVAKRKIPAAARPSSDSCGVANSNLILPARLDAAVTHGMAFQDPTYIGPNYTLPFRIPVNGVLSLSGNGNRYGAWVTLVQVSSEAALEACDLTQSFLVHDFISQGPAADFRAHTPGRYYFTSSREGNCDRGLKVKVVVTGSGEDTDGPLMTNSTETLQPFTPLPTFLTCERNISQITSTPTETSSSTSTSSKTTLPASSGGSPASTTEIVGTTTNEATIPISPVPTSPSASVGGTSNTIHVTTPSTISTATDASSVGSTGGMNDVTTTSTVDDNASDSTESRSNSNNTGIAIGVSIVLLLIIGIAILVYVRQGAARASPSSESVSTPTPPAGLVTNPAYENPAFLSC
eukprot:m.43637 g.43637  ORF g.43637 m.43637 type:complete len:1732 (+) comp9991_c0_seq1:353-5548(+)